MFKITAAVSLASTDSLGRLYSASTHLFESGPCDAVSWLHLEEFVQYLDEVVDV